MAYSAEVKPYQYSLPAPNMRLPLYQAYPSRLSKYQPLPKRLSYNYHLYSQELDPLAHSYIKQARRPVTADWTYRFRRWSLNFVMRMRNQLQLGWSRLLYRL